MDYNRKSSWNLFLWRTTKYLTDKLEVSETILVINPLYTPLNHAWLLNPFSTKNHPLFWLKLNLKVRWILNKFFNRNANRKNTLLKLLLLSSPNLQFSLWTISKSKLKSIHICEVYCLTGWQMFISSMNWQHKPYTWPSTSLTDFCKNWRLAKNSSNS